ncbi:MAG: DUF1707 domain-containing protein [Propioniciclava sp.]
MASDLPPLRLADADRDEAAALLREHYAAGRLEAAELDERLGSALPARDRADLVPLFADLPDPHPASLSPTVADRAPVPLSQVPATRATPPPAWLTRSSSTTRVLVWPIAIAAGLLSGTWLPWIVLAVIISMALNHPRFQADKRTPPPWDPHA